MEEGREGNEMKEQWSPKCIKCGQFLSPGKGEVEFTPDSHFGPEQMDWYHLACRQQATPPEFEKTFQEKFWDILA